MHVVGCFACAHMCYVKLRSDNQVMGLELVSIALGLSTFQQECSGRKVIVHSDNTGAEATTRKGSAKTFDHADILHEVWTHAVLNHMALWITRVATEVNIADAPSRMDYKALQSVGAEFKVPRLEEKYWATEAWRRFVPRVRSKAASAAI